MIYVLLRRVNDEIRISHAARMPFPYVPHFFYRGGLIFRGPRQPIFFWTRFSRVSTCGLAVPITHGRENMGKQAIALQYETPLRTEEVRVHRSDRDLTVEVGPISVRALVVQMVPVVAGALLLCAIAVAIVVDPRQPRTRAWVGMPIAAVVAIFYALAVFRNRNKPRRVMVVGRQLCFDNGLGLGLRSLSGDRPWRLVVRRRWWMPWHVRLEAVPQLGFWALHHPRANEPVVLLSGLSRSMLKEIARQLSSALAGFIDVRPPRPDGPA
jgi:hypothetical protein